MRAIDQRIASGATHIHLMLSCPGGSVFHGLSLHNFMKGLAIQISTYNFGSVDSIGVVLFCAGTKRYCVPSSRFHIHGVKLNFQGQGVIAMDEKAMEEHIKLLKTDYTNIARVIAGTTGRKEQEVVEDMNNQTSLLPEQAREYGLVHEVKTQLVPANANMTVIYEDATLVAIDRPPVQRDLAQPQPASAVPQAYTAPLAETFTATPMGFTGDGSSAYCGT